MSVIVENVIVEKELSENFYRHQYDESGTIYEFKTEFSRLQTKYGRAKAFLKRHTSLPYDKLPVFPLKTPYWSETEERYGEPILDIRSDRSLEETVNRELCQIRSKMPNLLYMRGNLHQATENNKNVRVLLVIEEVGASNNELAVVAVVCSKRGKIISFDIRRSAWPHTIHSDEEGALDDREDDIENAVISHVTSSDSLVKTKSDAKSRAQNISEYLPDEVYPDHYEKVLDHENKVNRVGGDYFHTEKSLPEEVNSSTESTTESTTRSYTIHYKYTQSTREAAFFCYFHPISYEINSQNLVPVFHKETTFSADVIAKAIYGVISMDIE